VTRPQGCKERMQRGGAKRGPEFYNMNQLTIDLVYLIESSRSQG
jgi:hypothetical protein